MLFVDWLFSFLSIFILLNFDSVIFNMVLWKTPFSYIKMTKFVQIRIVSTETEFEYFWSMNWIIFQRADFLMNFILLYDLIKKNDRYDVFVDWKIFKAASAPRFINLARYFQHFFIFTIFPFDFRFFLVYSIQRVQFDLSSSLTFSSFKIWNSDRQKL